MKYVSHTRIPMRGNAELSEKWLQERLVEDPGLLGFGEVMVKDVERTQSHGGRLDMLLADPETGTRYEVELQLGATDESHIIRTIEYWDVERRRFPQYDHVAVIVAEEITARFFNVISLFNGFIPIVAIQVSAVQLNEDEVTLVFTKVLDRMTLGSEAEDVGETVDRAYWEARVPPEAMAFMDQVEALLQEVDPGVKLKFNKYYVGLAKNGVATNYVAFTPRKKHVNTHFKIPRSDETTNEIEEAGLVTLPYDTVWNQYRPVFGHGSFDTHRDLIKKLAAQAHEIYFSPK